MEGGSFLVQYSIFKKSCRKTENRLEKSKQLFAVCKKQISCFSDIYKALTCQLPRPIKGTGLAKGPIPLYLSVVCSSCTWSWHHSLRALPDAAFACIPSVQRDYGYIAGRLTTPVFSFRQDVPNGNMCFNLLFWHQIVDWYRLIRTWFPECRYS